MTFVSAIRHPDGKKNLLHVDGIESIEEARMVVRESFPGCAILLGINGGKKPVTITEKVPHE